MSALRDLLDTRARLQAQIAELDEQRQNCQPAIDVHQRAEELVKTLMRQYEREDEDAQRYRRAPPSKRTLDDAELSERALRGPAEAALRAQARIDEELTPLNVTLGQVGQQLNAAAARLSPSGCGHILVKIESGVIATAAGLSELRSVVRRCQELDREHPGAWWDNSASELELMGEGLIDRRRLALHMVRDFATGPRVLEEIYAGGGEFADITRFLPRAQSSAEPRRNLPELAQEPPPEAAMGPPQFRNPEREAVMRREAGEVEPAPAWSSPWLPGTSRGRILPPESGGMNEP